VKGGRNGAVSVASRLGAEGRHAEHGDGDPACGYHGDDVGSDWQSGDPCALTGEVDGEERDEERGGGAGDGSGSPE
jgi:hypothetical protein